MQKVVVAYFLTLVIFGSGIVLAIRAGKNLEQARAMPVATATATDAVSSSSAPAPVAQPGVAHSLAALRENLRDPLGLLLVQLILIVVLARIFGALFVRMGQPAVIGEMLAGILLGPSLLGWTLPGVFQFVFPDSSLGALRMLSQVGIILFMYVVGMELDVKHLRHRADTAVLVSHVSILFPYFLGVWYSLFLYRRFAVTGVPFVSFGLFMGIAMSITAFPVLARILSERGLTQTFLGSTAITSAAVGDVSAWGMLAFVVAIVKAGGLDAALMTCALAVVFLAAMLLAVRPWLNQWVAAHPRIMADPPGGVMVGVLVMVFLCALMTQVIGIHALFGAFVAGLVMPAHPQFRQHLKDRLENFSSAFLLPLFFAYTGLRTQIGLLNDWQGWMACAGLIFLATLGKLGGGMFAARFTGMDWLDSFALGALMNTRGLVELIVLNIGLELGILSPRVFAMTVIMALVTTFMTGPLLSLGGFLRRRSPVLGATTQ
jgi:Kef-type K+ transport system membrane component KefB